MKKIQTFFKKALRPTGRHLAPPFLPPQAPPPLTAKLICPRHKHISICSTSVFPCISKHSFVPERNKFNLSNFYMKRIERFKSSIIVLDIFVTHFWLLLKCTVIVISFPPEETPPMLLGKSDL